MAWNPDEEEYVDIPVFVSFDAEDRAHRDRFEELLGGEYDVRDASPEAIRSADEGVLAVIVSEASVESGAIDRDIEAALEGGSEGPLGLLGILTPEHPDSPSDDRIYTPELVPPRLVANLESEYAELYGWADDSEQVQEWVEEAYAVSVEEPDLIDNSRWQPEREEERVVEG